MVYHHAHNGLHQSHVDAQRSSAGPWVVRALLPRLLEIIYEINADSSPRLRCAGSDLERQSRLSIIEQGPESMVRMAHLAVVCSFSVNGVAELHSRLPAKVCSWIFYDVVAGAVQQQNQRCHATALVIRMNRFERPDIAHDRPGWKCDLGKLTALMPHACDEAFQREWRHVIKQ